MSQLLKESEMVTHLWLFDILRPHRRWFGCERLEARLMRIMAMHAEAVKFLPIPFARSFPVHPGLPVTENGPMALSAEKIGFLKLYQSAINQSKPIPVIRIVAGKAPLLGPGVFELDILVEVYHFPAFQINLHLGVAFRTGEDPLREGGRRNKKLGDVGRPGCFLVNCVVTFGLGIVSRIGSSRTVRKNKNKCNEQKRRQFERIFPHITPHGLDEEYTFIHSSAYIYQLVTL
jgi:hypothetical protein